MISGRWVIKSASEEGKECRSRFLATQAHDDLATHITELALFDGYRHAISNRLQAVVQGTELAAGVPLAPVLSPQGK